MGKKTVKQYDVQKRFEVWLSVPIAADSFEAAVEKGRRLNFTDFVSISPGTSYNSCDELPGFGVSEDVR